MGGDSNQITVKIRELQNGVTKLISGRPQFNTPEFNIIAKAVFQSDTLILINFKELIRYDKEIIQDKDSYQYKQRQKFPTEAFKKMLTRNVIKLLPFKYKRETHPERTYLFLSESVTTITPNGKIYVMGGQFFNQYQKQNYMLVPRLQEQSQSIIMSEFKPFEEYAHLAAEGVQFFEIYKVKDMLNAKANFGHLTTNGQIFIAGGTSYNQFALKQVESYEIRKDIWAKEPDLNFERRMPSMCLFRNRYLYVFGGTQMKSKSELNELKTKENNAK